MGNRAKAGEHGAAKEGGGVERNVLIDDDHRIAIHHSMIGEPGDTQMVTYLGAVQIVQPGAAADQVTAAVRCGGVRA